MYSQFKGQTVCSAHLTYISCSDNINIYSVLSMIVMESTDVLFELFLLLFCIMTRTLYTSQY